MHTFEYTTGPGFPGGKITVLIHHNGDYSGDAIITVHREGILPPDDRLELPAAALVAFSRDAAISDAITALEELT